MDPKSDIDVINLELFFLLLGSGMRIGKRMEKSKESQSKVKEGAEKSVLEKIQESLVEWKTCSADVEEEDAIKHLCLLTMKPMMIYAANVAGSDLAEPENIITYVKEVKGLASDLCSIDFCIKY